MSNKQFAKDIVDYWKAVESFTPHKVETKNKTGYVQRIHDDKLGPENIPWNNRIKFQHKKTPTHSLVYTVFLGIIDISRITKYTIDLFDAKTEYSDSKQNKDEVTCLCSFQLNNYGEIIDNTFTVPDYFVSLSCLNQKDNYHNNWMSLVQKFRSSFQDEFDNKCNLLLNRHNSSMEYSDLRNLLNDIVSLSGLNEFNNFIKNDAIIYSSLIPVPNKFWKDKNNGDTKFRDINNIKEYTNPSLFPGARWPSTTDYTLSLAQQMAVNISLQKDEGVFSVNGPPGTGKSTSLRDIIAGVIFQRAESLVKFDDPNDAFLKPVSSKIKGYLYKAWEIDPILKGHEIVIASTNNAAVENISKEIPRSSEIDKKYNLDYFKEISSSITKQDSWGLGAAVLGKKKKNCLIDLTLYKIKSK